jgi:hypothetical protein
MSNCSGNSKYARQRLAVVAGVIGVGLLALGRWYFQPPRREKYDAPDMPIGTQIDRFLPDAEFNGVVGVTVHASPGEIMRAFETVTLADMPLAKLVGELRYLPSRLRGKAKDEVPASEPFLKLLQAGSGNIVLTEEPDRELVLGAIGKFHNLTDQQVVPLHSADDFLSFAQPDYQKLGMSIRIEGSDPETGCRLILEHRTHALSLSARWKFAFYWLAIKPGGNFVSWLLLRAAKRRAEGHLERQYI